jgi:PAS domain S-box-containing protein
VAAALALRLVLEAWVGGRLPTYVTFYPAVMAVALLAGLGPGLAATVLAGIVVCYWVLPPVGRFAIASPADRLGLALFTGMGLFMSLVAELYQRYRLKAAAYDREAALHESQARLAAFAEATFEGIIESQAGRIVDCNEQFARMLGYTAAELKGMEIAALVSPEDRARVTANIRQNVEAVVEQTALCKDGTRIVIESHGRPLAPGSTRRHTAVRDITQRKRVEEALREREEQLRLFVGHAPAAMAMLDAQMRYVAVSQRWLEDYDLTGQTILGRSHYELFPEIPERWKNIHRRCLAGATERADEDRFERADGSVQWIRWEIRPWHRAGGQVGGIVIFSEDITQRKQADDALEESEHRFRTMADAMPQLAWVAKADGFIEWYNRRWYEYTGTTPEQMEGWGWQSVHDPQTLPKVMERWKNSIATGESFDMTFPLRGADGQFRAFLTRVRPLKDSEGRVVQWFGTNTDVDELTRVEAALRESRRAAINLVEDAVTAREQAEQASAALRQEITERQQVEERLRELTQRLTYHVDNSPLAVIEWGPDMRLTRWSGAAERIFGWKAEEVLGKKIEDFRWVYQGDAAHVDQVSTELQTGADPRRFSANRNYRKDGSVAYCEWYNSSLLDESGKLRSIMSLVLDVTERKQAEKALREAHANLEGRVRERTAELERAMAALGASEVRYRTLFDTMDEGFCVVEMIYDPQGKPVDYRFVEVNPTFEKHTGLKNALGKTMRELVPKHDAHWFEIYGRVARTGEPTRFQNVAEAMQRFYDVFAFRIGEADRPRVGILFKDITEQKRAETALREAYATLELRVAERTAELARSNEDLQQFASIAGHDLQEPLRMVTGFLNLLEEQYKPRLDAQAHEYIGYAVEGAARMSQLIKDLLTYSRVTSKAKKPQPVEASRPLQAALANLYASIHEAGATVTHDDLPTVVGDAGQLTQLFQNLIGNALKFRHANRACRVHISARQQEGKWVFAVRDNGIGIAPEQFDRIFVIFQRLHTREKYPGTGIGLAICKKIVERHGGRIWVESKVGEGTTFYFAL